jgi:hypothetical protein
MEKSGKNRHFIFVFRPHVSSLRHFHVTRETLSFLGITDMVADMDRKKKTVQ